jgi:hypothetical protein
MGGNQSNLLLLLECKGNHKVPSAIARLIHFCFLHISLTPGQCQADLLILNKCNSEAGFTHTYRLCIVIILIYFYWFYSFGINGSSQGQY